MSEEICKHEASPATGKASFHHLPPPLSLNKHTSSGICQRSTTRRGKGIRLVQDYWNPTFISSQAAGWNAASVLQAGFFANLWRGKTHKLIKRWVWVCPLLFFFLYITGLFILVNIKQKQQQIKSQRLPLSWWFSLLLHPQVNLQWLLSVWHDNVLK